MLKKKTIVIWIAILIFVAFSGVRAQELGTKQRFKNSQGWDLPGVSKTGRVEEIGRRDHIVDGKQVKAVSIKPDHIRSGEEHPGTMDPDFDEKGTIIAQREIVANYIERYEIDGRTFCYVIVVSPYVYDEKSGRGRVMGIDIPYAYYDEDGNGVFKTKEMLGPMIVGANPYQLRLPEWAKRTPK